MAERAARNVIRMTSRYSPDGGPSDDNGDPSNPSNPRGSTRVVKDVRRSSSTIQFRLECGNLEELLRQSIVMVAMLERVQDRIRRARSNGRLADDARALVRADMTNARMAVNTVKRRTGDSNID